MNENVIFNRRVVNTLGALPADERTSLVGALSSEYFLGEDISETLAPFVRVMYAMLRNYVEQEIRRSRAADSDVITLRAL